LAQVKIGDQVSFKGKWLNIPNISWEGDITIPLIDLRDDGKPNF
jgi:hypothetical protein